MVEDIGYYSLHKKRPMRVTRMPKEFMTLPKKHSLLALETINIEKKIFYDLIEEGKEILEFGDDLENEKYDNYLFDDPDYKHLVMEFMTKSVELKLKNSEENKVENEGNQENENNEYKITLNSNEEEDEEIKNEESPQDKSLNNQVNLNKDRKSVFFGLILNLKS